MGTTVTTQELLSHRRSHGVTHVILIPFPSTAIASNDINLEIIKDVNAWRSFLPYFYIREDFRASCRILGREVALDARRAGMLASTFIRVLDDSELPALIGRPHEDQ